jgi:hypothetical protein
MKTIAVLLTVLAVCAARAETAGGWVKDAASPVLGGELGTCFDIAMLREDGVYKMWFSWRPKKSIAYTESRDGKAWSEPRIVLGPRSCDEQWESNLNRPGIFKKDGVYHLWYTGQGRGKSWIFYATSRDGVAFERRSEKPVLSAELPWEKVAVMCPHVEWDAEQGQWRMWYSGGDQYEPNAIGHAVSKDGLNWVKRGEPVLGADKASAWERHKITAAQFVRKDGWWLAFYIGFENEHLARIGLARSRDGLTGWERHPANPVIGPDAGTWDASACYKPWALYDAGEKRWRLWYNGRFNSVEQIGLATHEGADLGFPPAPLADADALIPAAAVERQAAAFNAADDELYKQAVPNAKAADFLVRNAPRFACPDADLERTFAFRWWTLRKHIRQTAARGFVFTEFLPNVGWAGKENTISCAAGHHFREARWLRDTRYLDGYGRFWFKGGGSPRSYSFWPADSLLQQACVTGDDSAARALLPDLIANYRAWEKERRDPNGLFWQEDGRDGMEVSAASEELKTTRHYRATLNSYMAAEARAIAELARRVGDTAAAGAFAADAARILALRDAKLWDAAAGFYKVAPRVSGADDALRFATDREQHGYTPWYFADALPPAERDAAWAQLADPCGFLATFGPTTTERRSPRFRLAYSGHECQWNGPSWPYSTALTLTGLANTLNARPAPELRKAFFWTLDSYVRSHALVSEGGAGVPWIDENLNPHTGDWLSRTRLKAWKNGTWDAGKGGRERGKDYNHSTFGDIVITAVAGLRPAEGGRFAVNPLVPEGWAYFALDNVRYHGHELAVVWDRDGKKFGRGAGLSVWLDGQRAAHRKTLGKLECKVEE